MNLEETNMKRFLMLSALLSLGLILGACGQSSSTEADHKNKAEETKTEQKANKEQKAKEDQNDQKTYKIGEKATSDGQTVTVSKVNKVHSGKYFATDGQTKGSSLNHDEQLVVVDITQENGSNEQVAVNPLNYELKNSDEKVHKIVASTVTLKTQFEPGDLAAGKKNSGQIAFVTKKNEKDLTLIFYPNFFTKEHPLYFNLSK